MKNDQNKADLNKMIAEQLLRPQSVDCDKEIVVSYNHTIKCKSDGIKDIFQWIDSTHEEADNRMMIHIADMITHKVSSITVRSLDTDVLVILISFMPKFLSMMAKVKLWLDFGVGENRKVISINDCHENLGPSRCLGLLFFHSFTGCDSSASYFDYPKTKWFTSWSKISADNELNSVFQKLSWCPSKKDVDESLNTFYFWFRQNVKV